MSRLLKKSLLMLEKSGLFCYNEVMKKTKYDLDGSQEVVITVEHIVDIISGIAEMSKLLEEEVDNMEPEKRKKYMVTLVALFTVVARLFPSKERKMIFEDLKEVVGVDLTDLM